MIKLQSVLLQVGVDTLETSMNSGQGINTLILFLMIAVMVVLFLFVLRTSNGSKQSINIDVHEVAKKPERRPTRPKVQKEHTTASPQKEKTHKDVLKTTTVDRRGSEKPNKEPEVIKPKKTDTESGKATTPKQNDKPSANRIKYLPNKTFEQDKPYSFPYVLMPEENSVFKTFKKGSIGRKGYKEDQFKILLDKSFKKKIEIYNDQVLTVGTNAKYKPDFCFIYDPKGKNIVIDIEIDEPYQGINDISSRKLLHVEGEDEKRNNAFAKRGWIVIRFAEIQVHQSSLSCCRFIANVIKSLDDSFQVPIDLQDVQDVKPIRHWSRTEAEKMSQDKYREFYLGIGSFGKTEETAIETGYESDEDIELEELISSEERMPDSKGGETNPKNDSSRIDKTTLEWLLKMEQFPKPQNEKPSIKRKLSKPPKKEVQESKLPQSNTQLIEPLAGDKISIIKWAISNERCISFVKKGLQNISVHNYQPQYVSQDILTGFCNVENRYIEYYIPHMEEVIIEQ